MSRRTLFLILTALGVAFEITGDAFIKKWSIDNGTPWLIIGFSIYLIGSGFWVASLKYEAISRAITIFMLLNVIGVVLVGLFIFREKLTMQQILGILLGIVALILIEL